MIRPIMTQKQLPIHIIAHLSERAGKGLKPLGADAIGRHVGATRPTVNRHLATLVSNGAILREGAGPATTYKMAAQ